MLNLFSRLVRPLRRWGSRQIVRITLAQGGLALEVTLADVDGSTATVKATKVSHAIHKSTRRAARHAYDGWHAYLRETRGKPVKLYEPSSNGGRPGYEPVAVQKLRAGRTLAWWVGEGRARSSRELVRLGEITAVNQ
jgi:hypothetical protein